MPTRKRSKKWATPKVIRTDTDVLDWQTDANNLPVDNISASSMVLFSTNPILFKIQHINRERLDTATNASAIVGKAFHRAMEVYYGLPDTTDEGEAIKEALKAGIEYLEGYPEGFINWTTTIDCRQKATERLAFAITEYLKQSDRHSETTLACEERMKVTVDIDFNGERLVMPIPLKGFCDRIVKDSEGRIKIYDYKTVSSFSNLDKIDGVKIVSAVQYYLMVHAAYGEAPYSMVYEEVKTTKNKDGGSQVRKYEVVFAEQRLYFDLYFRLYTDMVRALSGEMVYVPNLRALFDNEVALVAYIQRLDVPAEVAVRMAANKVTTITELLKAEIEFGGAIRDLLRSSEGRLAEDKTPNYDNMENWEKIRMKMYEHGIVLKYDSTIEGPSVRQYRFTPYVGVKMSRLRQFSDDIQQVLGTESVRIAAPIPRTTYVGIEVPRDDRRFPELPHAKYGGLKFAVGETVDGQVYEYDLHDAPHMLVAGSTGSGKSVFLHSVIQQFTEAGRDIRLHLFDPKRVELCMYRDKSSEYLWEATDIAASLMYLCDLMEERYGILSKKGLRDSMDAGMEPHVVIIDEFADLISASSDDGKGIMDSIRRLAQKGRAAGIHLIVATQRASVKVISGDIKVNFPCKAVFRMSKETDSRVMIDEAGAEKLSGKGDMLFAHDRGMERLQGYLPNMNW